MNNSINFMLVGVGGQGTILASDILAEVGLRLGYDVKKAEVHGMSQRGGSVISNLRWGREVFSPIIPKGEVDILIAFEKLEAARYAESLRAGGTALVNDYRITPVTVNAGSSIYPPDEVIRDLLSRVAGRQVWVKGVEIAESLGNVRTANVVLLGALSALLQMAPEPWFETIQSRVPPKYLEVNRKAFTEGRMKIHQP